MRPHLPALACGLVLSAPAPALANAPNEVQNQPEAQPETQPEAQPEADPHASEPWIRRWRPEGRTVELGLYGGLLLLNREHELFEPRPDLALQGWVPLRRLNPDFGARVGYYPFRFVGVELEGGAMPSRLADGSGDAAVPFTVRGQFVGQLVRWSVVPFVLAGGGLLGVNSRGPLGTDVDPALHFGGGVKLYLNRWLVARVDVRDVVSHQRGVSNTFVAHNLEVLLGLSVVLNRRRAPHAEPAPEPAAPGDRDGDGIRDRDDACPELPERQNGYQDADGCPEQDRDGDGFFDDQDACPADAGIAPDGCPVRDRDGDGILDDVDACVDEPETQNGFEDGDGCPDALPEELERFTGSIKGITFETNRATIRLESIPVLDAAVQILLQYPDVRIEIAGHTDGRGDHEHNMQLSRERAESVKSYLAGMGIDEARVETVGYGPDRPIDSNETKAGRANNRRIEFRVLTGSPPAKPASGGE